MAWNRPTESAERPHDERRRGRRGRLVILGAVACLVIGVGGVAIWLQDEGEKPVPAPEQDARQGLVKDVKPVSIPTNAVAVKPAQPKEPKLQPGEHRHVDWKRPDNWDELSPQQKTLIQPVGRVIKPKGWGKKRLFESSSDRRIERLLKLTPGRMFLGSGVYGEKFVRDFVNSLQTPIVITEADTPEEREMKKAVMETRQELKAAYDKGEDIAAIMAATEEQLRKAAVYRHNLEREINKYRAKEEHTEQDVKDYVAAANSILRDNGMDEFKLEHFWYHKTVIEGNQEENRE